MLKIDISRAASKFLETLPAKQKHQIAFKISKLLEDPKPHDCQILKGSKDYVRVDIGEYRIIYTHDHAYVRIFLVGKRNDDQVYKIFRRR